jgi:hypothetical protein
MLNLLTFLGLFGGVAEVVTDNGSLWAETRLTQ